MSLLCSTDTLREEADCISCDGYVTTGRRLEDAADEIDQLRAENEKLRELVQDVMPIVCDGCHERLCKMPKEEHPFITCWFADRLFELGIEVD